MPPRTRIIGTYISPYVRKVLVTLHLKGIDYELDPIIPFFGNDTFGELSPLRRIPVLMDDRVTLADSSVICQYLEDRYPEPALYPADIADRAMARWYEEYADSRMGDVLIWRLFNQVTINRFVWGEKPDKAVIEKIKEEEIPTVLDYLEKLAPEQGFVFGESLSIADISLATSFRNASFARYSIAPARWPRSAAYVARVLDLEAFARLRPFEEICVTRPIPEHRAALIEAGAPVCAETLASAEPRRGFFSV
ncbi:MAG: glutathione S-transferase family protein [Polyangiaceae bacterium]